MIYIFNTSLFFFIKFQFERLERERKMQLYQSKENKKDDKGDAISDIKTSQSKNITEDPLNGHASDLPKIDESSQTDPVVENGKY